MKVRNDRQLPMADFQFRTVHLLHRDKEVRRLLRVLWYGRVRKYVLPILEVLKGNVLPRKDDKGEPKSNLLFHLFP